MTLLDHLMGDLNHRAEVQSSALQRKGRVCYNKGKTESENDWIFQFQ